MKRSSKEFKAEAREALIGNYGTYIGSYLIYTLISVVINLFIYWYLLISNSELIAITGLIISFLFGVLTNLIKVGLRKTALSISRHQPIRIGDLFYGLTHHPDRFLVVELIMGLVYGLFTYLPIFFYTNYRLSGMITDFNFYQPTPEDIVTFAFSYTAGILLITAAGVLIASLLMMPFALSVYLLIDNQELSSIGALKESARMMKGNMGRYFYLSYLSFLGYYCLGYLGSMIPLLWIYPYREVTLSNFYRELKQEI